MLCVKKKITTFKNAGITGFLALYYSVMKLVFIWNKTLFRKAKK